MKKISLALMIISALSVSTAHAVVNGGEVHFIGSVSDVTCNINPVVDGVKKDVIQLGVMGTDGSGSSAVTFSLVPDSAGCLAKTEANVGWQSSQFSAEGLANGSGTATGAFIKLIALNSDNTAISATTQNATFSGTAGGIKSFDFTAQLQLIAGTAAATPGSVLASAAYTVAYL